MMYFFPQIMCGYILYETNTYIVKCKCASVMFINRRIRTSFVAAFDCFSSSRLSC